MFSILFIFLLYYDCDDNLLMLSLLLIITLFIIFMIINIFGLAFIIL